MENFIFSLKSVLPLFVLIVIGYVLKLMKWVNESFIQAGTKIVFKITLPMMLFLQVAAADLTTSANIRLMIFTVVSLVSLFLLLLLLVPVFVKKDPDRGAMIQALLRGNFSILGIPLAANMFGPQGAVPATLLMPFVIPIYNVFSVVALALFSADPAHRKDKGALAKKMLKEIVTNPLILAIVLGLAFSLLKIRLPELLLDCLQPVSDLTTPLALICLGAQFSFTETRSTLKLAVAGTLLRQLVIPFVMLTLAVLLGFRDYDLGAVLIIYASPVAVTSYIMAKNMKSNDKLAAQLLVFTTAFSCISLTLTIFLLRTLGYL